VGRRRDDGRPAGNTTRRRRTLCPLRAWRRPRVAPAHEPANLAAWAELHRQVEALPEEEREVFDLLWYQELTQAEAAGVLGVSGSTVKPRWVAARLRLLQALGEGWPD